MLLRSDGGCTDAQGWGWGGRGWEGDALTSWHPNTRAILQAGLMHILPQDTRCSTAAHQPSHESSAIGPRAEFMKSLSII